MFEEPDLEPLFFFNVPLNADSSSSQLQAYLQLSMLRQLASTSHDVWRVLGSSFHATSDIGCAAHFVSLHSLQIAALLHSSRCSQLCT